MDWVLSDAAHDAGHVRGEHHSDWDDLLPAVMMAYHSSVHKSTGFSPYRLIFGEECTLPMDVGLP